MTPNAGTTHTGDAAPAGGSAATAQGGDAPILQTDKCTIRFGGLVAVNEL